MSGDLGSAPSSNSSSLGDLGQVPTSLGFGSSYLRKQGRQDHEKDSSVSKFLCCRESGQSFQEVGRLGQKEPVHAYLPFCQGEVWPFPV